MTIKNSSIKLSILITVFIVVSLSGCFSQWQGDLAQIIISFGGAERSSIDYNPGDSSTHKKLEYKIVLTSAAEMLEYTFTDKTIFEASVTPGKWNVLINSYYEGDIYATGSKDVTLKPGLNNETIDMYESAFTEVPGRSLVEKLKWLSENVVGGRDYLIRVNKDESLEPQNFDQNLYYGGQKVGITLIGDTRERTISLSRNLSSNEETLFLINPGVTLTLGNNITLKGRSNNYGWLVFVNEDAKLIMNAGSKIKDNIKIKNNINNENGWIAGVFVNKKAIFEMNGGEISGIVAPGGGAVWVAGTFKMNNGNGKICNNKTTAEFGAAGVWVLEGGKFYMDDGTISDNIGGGVQVYNGGTFTMTGGTITRNTATGDGGGVAVIISHNDTKPDTTDSTFTMSGGIISGNKAPTGSGGGVAVIVWDEPQVFNSTFNMTGGTITDNTARDNGGGVSVWNGTFDKKNTGGTISNNNAANGRAVSAGSDYGEDSKKRENDIMPTNTLYYKGTLTTSASGDWD